MSSSESCCKRTQGKTCGSKNTQCNCKTYIKDDTCTTVIDCCGEKTGARYCICVCKCGEKTCVSIIDCEKDAPLEQELEQLQISNGEEISCNSKCFAEGDICIAVIDCCQNSAEKPKHCVCVVKCNGKLFKSTCGGATQYSCKCKCSEDGAVKVDCKKGNDGESPKKCVIVCDGGDKGGISVSVKEGNACENLEGGDQKCKCDCYTDKGICVAVVKC